MLIYLRFTASANQQTVSLLGMLTGIGVVSERLGKESANRNRISSGLTTTPRAAAELKGRKKGGGRIGGCLGHAVVDE